ncbi:MAG: hypothetical protein ACOCU1_00975 [Bacillota bacterium]
MKRLLLLLTLLTFTFTLFACGDDDTIVDQSPTFSHLIVDSREPTENGELNTYTKNKDEAIVVEVHFDNPSNAPINSVTINGQRYRTNRFEEGSSSTVVILNLTLRVTGETLYEVENFVYSDVNSVNIESNNTYQVFVLKNLPSATLSNLERGSEQLTMEIRVTDEDSVTLEDSTTVALYRDDTLIETKAILAGVINSVTFDDLLSNQAYSIRVHTDYNLDDGEGVVDDHLLLTDDTLTTLEKDAPSASISLDDINEETVDFNVSFTDESSVLVEDGLDIIISQDDTIIDSLEGVDLDTIDALSFSSLLNNNTYTISVYATYDLNDEEGIRSDVLLAESEFTTLQRPLPSIEAELMSISEDTLQLYVDDTNITTDVDLSDLVLTIYDNDTDDILTQTAIIDEFVTVEITGLLAHAAIRATITASFDLEDGQGQREGVVFEDTYQTTSNEAPTGTIDSMTLTQTTAAFTMSVNDTYNTVIEETLEANLYEDNVLIDTITIDSTSGSYTFEDQTIYHDRSYRITLITDYDLRDGNGVTEEHLLATFVKTDARPKSPEGTITTIEETPSGLIVHYNLYDFDDTLDTDGLTLTYHDELITLDPSQTSVTIEDYHKGVAYDFELHAAYTTTQDYEIVLASETYTTTANATPTMDIDIIPTDESLSGDIIVTDPDSTLDSYTVNIYQDSNLIHTQTDANISVFDLLSDTEYLIEVIYSYDLNDIEGMQTATETTTVTTSAKTMPSITFDETSLSIEETLISGSVDIDDPDSTLETYDITLYKDGSIIETLSNQETFTFTGLDSDSTYIIRIFKDYDLNKDGLKTDVQSDSLTFTTEQYEVTTVDSITEDTIILRVDADYLASDFDLTTLKAYAYDESGNVLAETAFKNNEFTFEIEGLYADQPITMHLEAEDLTGTVNPIQIKTYKTEANTVPTADISNVTLAQTTIDFSVNITDTDDTITDNLVAHLYENGTLIETLELTKNQTAYQFDNLAVYADETYEIIIETDYDLRDEAGLETEQFLDSYVIENVRDKAPEVVINDVTSDPSGIHITYEFFDYDNTLETDGLTLTYNDTTITLDESGSHTITSFNNDETYDLSIIASYLDHKGETQTVTATQSHQTHTLVEPTVTIEATQSETSIDGSITWLDDDSTRNATYDIVLYRNDSEVDRVTDTDTFSFTGLLSDAEYTIRVEYTYDLNDGAGDIAQETSETIRTDAYLPPTLDIDDTDITVAERIIEGSINITDTDNTLTSYHVELSLDDALIDTINDTSTFTFDYLLSGETYEVTLIYTYDLNDGQGVIEEQETLTYTTETYNVLTVNELREDAIILDIDSNYLESDFDLTTLKAYVYNEQETLIASAIFTTDVLNLDVSNVYADQTLTIVIEAEDMQGNPFIIETITDTTEANEAPEIIISDMEQHQTSIDFDIDFTDADETLLNTPTAYLYENGTLIDTLAIDTEITEYTFEDLEVYYNNTYEIRIRASINLRDETGVITDHNLGSYSQIETHKKAPTLTIDNVSFDSLTGIDIDYILYDYDDSIISDGADLIYNNTTISLDETLNGDQTHVISNYFDEDASLYITITYLDRYGDEQTIETSVETLSIATLTEPTYTLSETITDDSISGTITWDDPDNTITTTHIHLYRNDTLIDTVTDDNSFDFTGLFSDETYDVVVEYEYDMNISAGISDNSDTYTYTTNALTLPTVTIDNINKTTPSEITVDISVTDTDATLDSPLSVMIYEGANLLDTQTITSSDSIVFDNLTKETTYTIVISADIDQNLSSGIYNYTFINTDETLPNYHPDISYNDVEIEQERIDFFVELDDIYGTLTDNLVRIELLDEDNTQVGTSDYIETDMKVKLMNLYSDNTYTVNVYVQVDYQDGAGSQEILLDTQTYTTEAKTPPSVTVNETISTTHIEGILTWTDPDSIKDTHTISLYQGDAFITSVTDTNSFDFTGLFSNETYTVVIEFSYDLNDGEGSVTNTTELTYTTDDLTEPDVTPDNVDVTDDAISGDVDITDPDNTIASHTVSLYLGETLIDSETDTTTFDFTGLLSDATYTLVISVTYDLNEVDDPTTKETNYTYTTDTLTIPTGEIETLTITGTTIEADISEIVDPDNVLSTADVVLFADNVEVESIATAGDETVTFTESYDSNTQYVVKLIITYDLGDGEGAQTRILDQIAYIEATKS